MITDIDVCFTSFTCKVRPHEMSGRSMDVSYSLCSAVRDNVSFWITLFVLQMILMLLPYS